MAGYSEIDMLPCSHLMLVCSGGGGGWKSVDESALFWPLPMTVWKFAIDLLVKLDDHSSQRFQAHVSEYVLIG